MKKAFEPAFDARRTALATVLVGAFFFGLIVRLYVLQIVRGEEYLAKGQSNFVQERRIAHARGIIFDQAGRILVDNRPSHDVFMTAAFLPDSTRALAKLLAPAKPTKLEIAEIDRLVLSTLEQSAAEATAAPARASPTDLVLLREGVDVVACGEIEAYARKEELRGLVIESGVGGACSVSAHARDFPSRAAVFRRARELVGLGAEEMKERVESALKKSRGLGRFKPTILLEDIGFDAYARLEAAASLGDLPGIEVVDSQRRRYRHKTLGAHVLGYMNEISPKEMEQKKLEGYFLGDMAGRRGIEASHEVELRGKDGIEPVVVDAKGRNKGPERSAALLGVDRIKPPLAGQSLILSIDEDMQRAAEENFQGLAGSVVAMEVNTGFILAMASFPAYDANQITGPWSKEYSIHLMTDPLRPWNNKAIQEHYAPGSTFKAITAAAGLRNQLIDERRTRSCPGFFRLGRSTWRCYNRGGHGSIALVRALQYSCDAYFYSLGFDLGPDRLADSARLFGFGSRTGLDLDRETPGIMPDRAYYVRRFGAYTPGLVVNNAIGQGDVAVTSLQLAVAYAAIANGGTVYQPQLVREVRDANGETVSIRDAIVTAELGLDKATMGLIREALAHVTDSGGTASGLLWKRDRFAAMSQWLRESGVTIVGKTGTAQVVKLAKDVAHLKVEDTDYLQRDHAWFVGFAPKESPEVVVVTMTEHGGFGGSTSAPVTAEVLRTFFTKVRGSGRYANAEPLAPSKRVFVPPGESKQPEELTEESPPPTAIEPEIDRRTLPDLESVMPAPAPAEP